MIVGGKVKQLATGYTKHYKASELAAVKTGLGASSSGCTARLRLAGIGQARGRYAGLPAPPGGPPHRAARGQRLTDPTTCCSPALSAGR